MSKTEAGRKAPKFSLPSTTGERFAPADVRGSNLVIYFYPRDNTSGCTREAQDFRELHGAFRKANTVIVGISPDSIESHQKFKSRFKLPFALLSDEDRKVCEAFEVIREKSMYGRKFMGVERIGEAARQDARTAEQGCDFLQFAAGCCRGCLRRNGHGRSPRHLSLEICHLSQAISSAAYSASASWWISRRGQFR